VDRPHTAQTSPTRREGAPAEIHVNEGVCEVFDVVFPPKGTLITPEWPAATNCALLRVCCAALGLLAGVVAQAVPGPYPGRPGDDPLHGILRQPIRTASRFLSARGESVAVSGRAAIMRTANDAIHIVPDLAQTSRLSSPRRGFSGGGGKASRSRRIPAVPAKRRGGLGYDKHYRALVDCRTIVTARPRATRLLRAASMAARPARPFSVTIVFCSLPPLWGRVGVGGSRGDGTQVPQGSTPTPDPLPTRGRGRRSATRVLGGPRRRRADSRAGRGRAGAHHPAAAAGAIPLEREPAMVCQGCSRGPGVAPGPRRTLTGVVLTTGPR